MDIDSQRRALARDANGNAVYLAAISGERRRDYAAMAVRSIRRCSRPEYGSVFEGDDRWRGLKVPDGDLFRWGEKSSYVKAPPFFDGVGPRPRRSTISKMRESSRCSATASHRSHLAGGIDRGREPAGATLVANGVSPRDFNSYGARRGITR